MASNIDGAVNDRRPQAAHMIDLIGAHEWVNTGLGPRHLWSATLRITIQTMLASLHPMCVIWGPDRILLYNDGYAPILGARHPGALGRTTREVWPELWTELEPLIDSVFAGESVSFRDQPLTMTRNGFPEETWYDFAYSPIRDEAGEVVGLLNITSESTSRVKAKKQQEGAAAELSANDAKWRRLFETLQEGFILGEVVRDTDGKIVD